MVNKVNQLFEMVDIQQKRFLTIEEIKQKVPNVNFLDYHSLTSAIPKNWIKKIKESNLKNFNLKNYHSKMTCLNAKSKKDKGFKASKYIYDEMLCLRGCIDNSKSKWEMKLKIDLAQEEWENLRLQTFKVLQSTKLQFFQYRVLSNRLMTNRMRHMYDTEISPACTFCNKEIETILHLLCDCSKVRTFWKTAKRWLKYMLNLDLELKKENVILVGIRGQYSEFKIIFVTIAKQYLYVVKCTRNQIHFSSMLLRLHQTYLDKKFFAKQNKEMYKFMRRWSVYHTYAKEY